MSKFINTNMTKTQNIPQTWRWRWAPTQMSTCVWRCVAAVEKLKTNQSKHAQMKFLTCQHILQRNIVRTDMQQHISLHGAGSASICRDGGWRLGKRLSSWDEALWGAVWNFRWHREARAVDSQEILFRHKSSRLEIQTAAWLSYKFFLVDSPFSLKF